MKNLKLIINKMINFNFKNKNKFTLLIYKINILITNSINMNYKINFKLTIKKIIN